MALPTPPPTAPVAAAADDTPTVATPTSTATILAAIPALLPVPPGIAPEHEPIPPPTTIGELAEVYLTPCARTSRGVHPTVLEILPDVVGGPEVGTWYVVTIGRYTGIYPEWYLEFIYQYMIYFLI